MDDFKTRLELEYKDLGEKADKLLDFIQSDNYTTISPLQQSVLRIQSSSMFTYLTCLEERLNNL